MKKATFWCIPALFYFASCVLNLIGCLTTGDLERCMKPALMPLLSVTTLAYLLAQGHSVDRKALLLLCGQLFGFAGDTALMGKHFFFFAGGILLFLIGHIFYVTLFGGQSWKGLKTRHWILALAGMIAATGGLICAIGVNGVMLAPMGIYGFMLTVLIFSTLAGVLRPGHVLSGGRFTWLILLLGALLFTFSDSLIAVRNFGELSPFMSGFGVMFTYLAAQTLLAIGGIRLILNR